MILGIDTSLGTSVAVVEDDGAVHGVAESADPRGHAEAIGRLLVEALGGEAAEVTHVAAGMGPGPFTGLRVGIAAARAFAVGRALPVVAVASHDAVALDRLTAEAIAGLDGAPFAVVTDARRREVAVSVYTGLDDDGLPVRSEGPFLVPAADVDARLADLDRVDADRIPAVFLALAASRALTAGRRLADDQPLYLRAPDVTAPRAPKRVTA